MGCGWVSASRGVAKGRVMTATATTPAVLDAKHRAELYASGIDDATIDRAGIYSAADGDIRAILGWNPKDISWGRGYVLPFFAATGDALTFKRVKLDHPRMNGDADPIKYESPRKAPNRAYFPPGFADAISDPAAPLIFTEGEKKALCAAQRGFACIGLVGVWGFTLARPRGQSGRGMGPRRLIDDLNAVHYDGRTAYVAFDSDAADKREVRQAENELAAILTGRGADVRIIRLPQVGEGKTGLDDFLLHHGDKGAAALRALMADAKPAQPERREAARVPPMVLADEYITAHLMRDNLPIARHYRDEWHSWTGTHYKTVATGDFTKRVLVWLNTVIDSARPRLAGEVAECMAARLLVAASRDLFLWLNSSGGPVDAADWLAMSNGILDVRGVLAGDTKVLRPHSSLWFTANSLPYSYDATATCPTWFGFLDQVFDGDAERVDLLAEWFGYCLTPDTRHQAILLMVGPRRSGKGTTLRVLRRLVGEHNCIDPRLTTLADMFGLQGLIGKTVAICPDAHLGHGDKALSVLETLKSISGEDSLEVHRKHLPSISTRLRTRFTLAVNELPKFGDSANALASRLLVLTYNNSYQGREDRELEDKLAREVPGVLNWALWGLGQLQQNGRFTVPAASREVAEDFERLSNPLAAFIEDCCDVAPDAQVERGRLWDAWRTWCDDNGHHAGGRDRLGARLRALIPQIQRSQPRADGRRLNVYTGLSLTGQGGTSGTT